MRFVIRPLGMSVWGETDSPSEARDLYRECTERMGGTPCVIVDSHEDRDVTDELMGRGGPGRGQGRKPAHRRYAGFRIFSLG